MAALICPSNWALRMAVRWFRGVEKTICDFVIRDGICVGIITSGIRPPVNRCFGECENSCTV